MSELGSTEGDVPVAPDAPRRRSVMLKCELAEEETSRYRVANQPDEAAAFEARRAELSAQNPNLPKIQLEHQVHSERDFETVVEKLQLDRENFDADYGAVRIGPGKYVVRGFVVVEGDESGQGFSDPAIGGFGGPDYA